MLRLILTSTTAALLFAAQAANALEWFGNTLNGSTCTGRSQGFGPYDFFDVDNPADALYQEGRWWEVRVLHGQKGVNAMNEEPFNQDAYNRAAGEFDYVLRAFPNQPETLQQRISLEMKRIQTASRLQPYITPPECYLERARIFRPQQAHIPYLRALYLHQLGKLNDALTWYTEALRMNGQSAEVHYNAGLAYLDSGNYEKALEHANKAYELGFPLPGLRNRLSAARPRAATNAAPSSAPH